MRLPRLWEYQSQAYGESPDEACARVNARTFQELEDGLDISKSVFIERLPGQGNVGPETALPAYGARAFNRKP